MAAAMELRCWGADWGLPSVHSESLIVQVTGSPACGRDDGPVDGFLLRCSSRPLRVFPVSRHANVPAAACGSRSARGLFGVMHVVLQAQLVQVLMRVVILYLYSGSVSTMADVVITLSEN